MRKILVFYLIVFYISFWGCKKENKIHQLYIETNKEISNQKTDIKIHTKLNQQKFSGNIKTRGGSSINFPKKSYEINLNNDTKLAGLPADDDWILNANFIDKTFLRHVISYELFQDMSIHNITSKTKYVELFINNSYEGLYVLMEKLDKSTFQIDTQDSLSFIFKEPHIFRKNYSHIIPQKKNNFHQQTFPKISNSNKYHVIENIRNFIINSNDSVFTKNIEKVFNLNNIIDWHLLLLITNNSDGVLKNFYLYKISQNDPVRIAPWDYDHSFGRDGDNELNLNTRKVDVNRSILFKRLLEYDWYKSKLKKRWIYLNNKHIVSATGIKNRISKKNKELQDAIIKNHDKWPIYHPAYYDNNNSHDEIKIMYNFIEKKYFELDDYFKNIQKTIN